MNLPGQYAQWMKEKATKRKKDDENETVFFNGGLQGNKSDLGRPRKKRGEVKDNKVWFWLSGSGSGSGFIAIGK